MLSGNRIAVLHRDAVAAGAVFLRNRPERCAARASPTATAERCKLYLTARNGPFSLIEVVVQGTPELQDMSLRRIEVLGDLELAAQEEVTIVAGHASGRAA